MEKGVGLFACEDFEGRSQRAVVAGIGACSLDGPESMENTPGGVREAGAGPPPVGFLASGSRCQETRPRHRYHEIIANVGRGKTAIGGDCGGSTYQPTETSINQQQRGAGPGCEREQRKYSHPS